MVSARAPARAAVRRAVALVDAIAAVIIMGVSLTVILSLTGQAVSSQRRGDDLATAAMLADEQLSMVLARGPDGYAKSFPVVGACEAPFERFRYELAFTGGGGSEAVGVRVTIAWDDNGRERRASVDTRMAPRSGGPENQQDRRPEQPVERSIN
jgi:hypothetical protein